MVWVLKAVFLILLVISVLSARVLYRDWKLTRKTVSYENSTILNRIKIQGVVWTAIGSILIFSIFLVYLILSKIEITSLWS